ncbi:MAG: phosphomethylpyrimidine kinase [Gammaproteobacteria bacterium SG8_47]|nr:MAG: phosphomethylpyrimidine kinase [Gammaproteobacteria bacterium SG8_47]
MSPQPRIPVVLVFAGLDPTGGAGLQADIEAIASMGCHAAPIATALTVQDTHDLHRYASTDPGLLIDQARAVLEDMPVHAIKVGMLGSAATVEAIQSLLADYAQIPVVLDPVLAAGGGHHVADAALVEALLEMLVPQVTVLTPNSSEARVLAPQAATLDQCAQALLSTGCEFVLITGTHEQTEAVENKLYGEMQLLETYSWPRLPLSYHGSGCTLAAAIAGLLAQGVEPLPAIYEAQEYTWEALSQGYRLGTGQLIPNRLFWARGEEEPPA